MASGNYATVGGGYSNEASNAYASVGGGRSNAARNDYATVGGGGWNIASGAGATIAGGGGLYDPGPGPVVVNNTVTSNHGTIGGGGNNFVSGPFATVSGGYTNEANYAYATVGGGQQNAANAPFATVGGGDENEASGSYATVSGGSSNAASGWAATVPGGTENLAQGFYSLASGRRAKANNTGCFVWGDSTDADVSCSVNNRWVARSSGGVYFYTNAGLTSGVYVASGGTGWSSISDRSTKENFRPVDAQSLLDRVASMPVQEYNLKSQDASIRHIGPVAQDFALFGYGESNLGINMQDADGVALAAIQGLYQQNQEQAKEIQSLKAQLSQIEKAGSAPKTSSMPVIWVVVGLLFTAQAGMFFFFIRRQRGRL